MKEDKVAKILKRRLYRHYVKKHNEEITLGFRVLTLIDKAIGMTLPIHDSFDRERCDRAIDRNIWALKELYDIKARIRERERLKPSSAENDRLKEALQSYLDKRLENVIHRITNPYEGVDGDLLLKRINKLNEEEKNDRIEELKKICNEEENSTLALEVLTEVFTTGLKQQNERNPIRINKDALKAMLFPPTYFDTFKHHFYHSYPLLPVRWVSGLILFVLACIATPLYGCCLGCAKMTRPYQTKWEREKEQCFQKQIDNTNNSRREKFNLSQDSSEDNSEHMKATTRCFCFNFTLRKKKRRRSASL